MLKKGSLNWISPLTDLMTLCMTFAAYELCRIRVKKSFFPSTKLLHQNDGIVKCVFVMVYSGLIVVCGAVFGWYPWISCWRGGEGEVCGMGGGSGERIWRRGEVVGRRTTLRM